MPQAAVDAAMDALGCRRNPGPKGMPDWCRVHSVDWHPEGCGDALAAVEAVLAAVWAEPCVCDTGFTCLARDHGTSPDA